VRADSNSHPNPLRIPVGMLLGMPLGIAVGNPLIIAVRMLVFTIPVAVAHTDIDGHTWP
jgi:hypothetical protein